MSIPSSLQLDKTPPPLSGGCRNQTQVYFGDNASYAPQTRCVIRVPMQANTWLHGSESYLSFKLTSASGGAGAVISLDSSAYAVIESVRLSQGGNLLVHSEYANRIWNAMRDFSCSSAMSDSISLGVGDTPNVGQTLTTTKQYSYSMCLPMPIIGSMNGAVSCPMGWIQNGGDLSIEIVWAPSSEALNTTGGTTTDATASYTIQDVLYTAKTTVTSPEIDASLRAASGGVSFLHAQHITTQQAGMSVDDIYSNKNYGFNYHSAKAIYWWMTPSLAANPAGATAYNWGRAVGNRTAPNLSSFYAQINGVRYPQSEIDCLAVDGNGVGAGKYAFHAGQAYGSLQQAMNTLSESSSEGCISAASYTSNQQTPSITTTSRGGFLGGIDLDRGSQISDTSLMGEDTRSSTVSLVIKLRSKLTAAHNLYVACLHDTMFRIEMGRISLVE
jgi:hypothetical protein